MKANFDSLVLGVLTKFVGGWLDKVLIYFVL